MPFLIICRLTTQHCLSGARSYSFSSFFAICFGKSFLATTFRVSETRRTNPLEFLHPTPWEQRETLLSMSNPYELYLPRLGKWRPFPWFCGRPRSAQGILRPPSRLALRYSVLTWCRGTLSFLSVCSSCFLIYSFPCRAFVFSFAPCGSGHILRL